ncbi:MAG TPA: PilZ domain-containing protein [Vicinamibacteria bacterium]|nr:PilZ domain-containing protein [Vicinamibacteria bacterium]
MTSDEDGRERRRWPRAPLRGKVVGQIYTEHAAPILDLSEGGALLEVPCALRPRSVYSVRLDIGVGPALTLKASVVRSYVHRVESAGKGETQIRYQAALQFVDMRAEDHELLRRWIAGEVPAGTAGLTRSRRAGVQAPVERRDSLRVDLAQAVAGEVGLHLESRVLMLSPGGMTVRMPFRPEIGSAVTCMLDILGVRAPLRGIVRDVHQEADEDDGSDFLVGMEFTDLSDETRASIAAYLRKLGSPSDGAAPRK